MFRCAAVSYILHRHLEHESNKLLGKGCVDSNVINWWRAIALGFICSGTKSRMAEALRELNLLRLKRDLELPSIVALLFFHQTTDHIDYQEVDVLTELATIASERASDCSLLLAAQFHLYTYSGIVPDEKVTQQRLKTSRSFLTKVECSVASAEISPASLCSGLYY